jgi:hypothetical protein
LFSSARANLAFDCTTLQANIFQGMVVQLLKLSNCFPDFRFVDPSLVDLRWKPQSFGEK